MNFLSGLTNQSTSSSLNNLKNYNDLFNGHDAFGSSKSFNNIKMGNQQSPPFQANFSVINNGMSPLNNMMNMNNPPPSEDKYAALKELELSMKSQQSQQNQEVSSTNGGVWTSPKETKYNRSWESEFNHSGKFIKRPLNNLRLCNI